MKAISIKQPWAYLIAAGIKDVENRTWKCPEKYIGKRVFIHVSASKMRSLQKTLNLDQLKSFEREVGPEYDLDKLFAKSSIIGSVEIVDCVINHSSIWAEKSIDCKDGCPDVENCPAGKCPHLIYNWILANPILFDEPITNVKGKLSFWDYEFSEDDYKRKYELK